MSRRRSPAAAGALGIVVILLAVGVFGYGVDLPSGSDWITFVWVSVLGSAACTLLGIAISSLAKNGRTASAMITPIAIVLQFISGVYIAFDILPEWLQHVASVFPLRWTAAGMRAVFLPESFEAAEPGGTWALPLVAIVCLIWLVAGLIVCAITFRWNPKDR